MLISANCLILDNIAAQRDAWIVGDVTLAEIFNTLPTMRRKAKISRHEQHPLISTANTMSAPLYNKSSMLHNTLLQTNKQFHQRH